MANLTDLQPEGRFTSLADLYGKHRPSYPAEALDFVQAHCGLARGSVLVDVGCGTGIASRLFAERGLQVIGVEPNAAMREQAIRAPASPGVPPPSYRDGKAEATGLADGQADAVLAAQAFHWFEPEPALREFRRILRPGGWAILIWNLRDESDPFTAAYGALYRATTEGARVEQEHYRSGDRLLQSPLFVAAEKRCFANSQVLDEEGVIGRALSVSYAPREQQPFVANLRTLFRQHARDGQVTLRYLTEVFVARCVEAST